MTLVTTTILTADSQTLIVPNKSIWDSAIRNALTQGTHRVDFVFGIAYSEDYSDPNADIWKNLCGCQPAAQTFGIRWAGRLF